MRRVRPLVALAIAGVMLLPGAATAAPSVSITGVTVTGGTGSVSGTASFEALTGAVSVAGPDAVHNNGALTATDAGAAAGVQLTDATITELPNGLRFAWHLTSMPEQTPPEAVRYVWGFVIGDREFEVIAKRVDMTSLNTTEDPIGYAQRAASGNASFRLRGACGPYQGTPVNGCYHLGFLNGSIDPANKRVTVDLPYEAKDQVGRVMIPELKPGAVLRERAGGVFAAFQYGPLSVVAAAPTVTDSITGISPYFAGGQVMLGVAAPNQDPASVEYTKVASLNGDTFSGTVTGLTGQKNSVYARACKGTECSYTSFKAL